MHTRLRTWSSRTFYDPAPVLIALRKVELALADAEMPDLVRRLRTNKLKAEREARIAALFAYGMAGVIGTKVWVAPGEIEDCDFITRFRSGDVSHFSCVQLKELAPADLSPAHNLESLLIGISSRPASDAVLLIHLNRRDHIALRRLGASRLPFAEVWYLWASAPNSSAWTLYGNAKGVATCHNFAYPEG
jgi:hypothetical protein